MHHLLVQMVFQKLKLKIKNRKKKMVEKDIKN